MASTFHFRPSPSFTLTKQTHLSSATSILHPSLRPSRVRRTRQTSITIKAFKVVIEHDGKSTEMEVDADESILSKALDIGLSVPHDCKLGVCMTCPARVISGSVDQSEGMLSDDVVESGYALLCVAYPTSDCQIKTIPEEELLSLQLVTAND